MAIQYYIYLSLFLFFIGVLGVIIRRNLLIIFMCIELMLNAVILLFISFSKMHANGGSRLQLIDPTKAASDGQIFVFFIMVVAAAEVAIGLAIIIMMYKNLHNISSQFLNRLKN